MEDFITIRLMELTHIQRRQSLQIPEKVLNLMVLIGEFVAIRLRAYKSQGSGELAPVQQKQVCRFHICFVKGTRTF